jgi:hypothetical protein
LAFSVLSSIPALGAVALAGSGTTGGGFTTGAFAFASTTTGGATSATTATAAASSGAGSGTADVDSSTYISVASARSVFRFFYERESNDGIKGRESPLSSIPKKF